MLRMPVSLSMECGPMCLEIECTFLPPGDIIDLPVGSTPIDFAFHVHTEVGYRCRGSKVNGKLVSLDHNLKTGDQVEILTAKRGGPSRDWWAGTGISHPDGRIDRRDSTQPQPTSRGFLVKTATGRRVTDFG